MKRACNLMVLAALLLTVLSTAAWPQKKKSGEDQNARSVQGVVEDQQGNLIEGAVVQLKNTKSLQVRSFITLREGSFYFHGLSPEVDYELKAEFKDSASPVRRLSIFDSRKKAIVNLKLEPQK